MEIRVCAVVPVLNEEKFIARCINSLLAQTMPVDILIMEGGSTDSTKEILSSFGDVIKVIDNPEKRVANARNLALEHIDDGITHCLEIIGHSWIDADHVEKRVNDLIDLEAKLGTKIGAIGCLTDSGDSAGMVAGWVEGAISSPIGSGGGQFKRFKGREQTKIPAFCLHNVDALRSVGGWDERFITSQDSDLSMRLISDGWQLWRSDISCVYMHKRSTLGQWWKMCHRYGFWRTKVLLRHPKRFDPKEILPIIGIILIFALPKWWLAPAIYACTILSLGVVDAIAKSKKSHTIGVPICLVILHTAFTIGLFDGLIRKGKSPNDRT